MTSTNGTHFRDSSKRLSYLRPKTILSKSYVYRNTNTSNKQRFLTPKCINFYETTAGNL
uniref:Uncharacterized protein n=1 Tax=Arundo donax TaxID=35708 RepID=A0A0A9BFB8_ARUDO